MVIFDQFPIWTVFLGTLIVMLLAAEIGFRVGMWFQRRDPDSIKTSVTGAMVGGMLGLMAFLLAFTIGIVINQHNTRKGMVVDEANAIGTTYLRASFLAESNRDVTRELLREYVEVRLSVAADLDLFDSGRQRSEEIHSELWSVVEESVDLGNASPITALFVNSINEVIDFHALRLAAFDLRLPKPFGLVLYAAALFSFLLVGVASSADGKRSVLGVMLFALAFVAVQVIVVDLDRPQQGLFTVSQNALSDLLRQMTP